MRICLPIALVLLAGCAGSAPVVPPAPRTAEEMKAEAASTLEMWLANCVPEHCGLRLDPGGRVDSIRWQADTLTAYLNRAFAQAPLRESGLAALEEGMSAALAPLQATLRVRVQDLPAAELIPNLYRTSGEVDDHRRPGTAPPPRPVV